MKCETRNAIIRSASLFLHDGSGGLLTSYLDLDYGGSGQAFGGWGLYLPKGWKHHELLSHAGHWIYRVMQVAGVEKWSDLPGRTIRVRQEHTRVHAIGHVVLDDLWFCPEDEFPKKEEPDARS